MEVRIEERRVAEAAARGSEAFVTLFRDATLEAIGGELNAETMPLLNADQITLLAYETVRREVSEGGFVQLIHNGYGPFIFLNPFAKAMRLWGAREFQKLVYKGRKLYEKHARELTRECEEEEFMELYWRHPEFDALDDEFVETEEEVTALVAHYIDDHIDRFATIVR